MTASENQNERADQQRAASARREDDRAGSVSRRDFLRAGGMSVVGLSVAERAALRAAEGPTAGKNVILLVMNGGPSQLDTFDPKPEAPSEVRGPLKSIATTVPGVHVSEAFPRIAERMDRLAIIRSLWHPAAPIHETGYQLLHTGRLSLRGVRHPSFGSVVSRELGPRGHVPAYVVLPRLMSDSGVAAYRGQQAGFLGADYEPLELSNLGPMTDGPGEHAGEPKSKTMSGRAAGRTTYRKKESPVVKVSDQATYGETACGRLCRQARILIESGVRVVVVNLFDTLNEQLTWDCHGNARGSHAGSVFDYRDTLGPQFDRAYAALIDDLANAGLLDETLVMATGEFGRTPRINEFGGRDHWTKCWSALVAGGGICGGQTIGASDAQAASVVDRPVHPGELVATIYHSLGISDEILLQDIDAGDQYQLTNFQPIGELFGLRTA